MMLSNNEKIETIVKGRFYQLVEKNIDIFIEICKLHIKKRHLENKIKVIKDEQLSVVAIGDPNVQIMNKNFGFVFYYEMIFGRDLQDVNDEFKFKLDHFIKTANQTNKFPAFKNEKQESINKENSQSST